MAYFWTARENVPYGIGFTLYHWQHLLWILGIVLTAVWTTRWFCRATQHSQKRLLHILVWLMAALEVCKDLVLLGTGQFRAAYLPLDLCGLSIGLELAAVYRQNTLLCECVYSLSLPGACLALLFPNWNKLPMLNFFCLYGFVLRGLLVLIPVLLFCLCMAWPNAKRLPFCFGCIALTCIPVSLVNRRFGTNFFFLSAPLKGSPLVWFERVCGSHLI
ncbi:MAG: YwaF family protein [Ruminococcus sp.]|nr:YwaF family protein [Ruminococcus sp.]